MIHKYILLTILLIVSNNTTAKDIEYVKTKDIIMSFVSEFNPDVSDDAISVYIKDSRGNYLADRLPYLSSKGRIKEAFYVNSKELEKTFFVIQESQVDSDTGMNWKNYFNVIVYSYSEGKIARNHKLTTYFGSGGDIINTSSASSIAFKYPYSTKQDILRTTNNPAFLDWMHDKDTRFRVKGKSYFFPEPMDINKSKVYVLEGDFVTRKKHDSGWDYVEYKTKTGKVYSGWMLCSLIGSC